MARPLGALQGALRLAWHAAASPRLLVRRYLLKRPVQGSLPYEVRLHERYWERRLAADTGGWSPVSLDDAVQYEGTPYLLLLEILRTLDLGPDDKLVDLGCGKGRVVVMAAQTRVGRVAGVEQDETFLDIARQNLARHPALAAKVELFHGLAQGYDFDDTTVVFLFNPFGARTMQDVLELLRQSLQRRPRPLRLVYVNPVHEQVLRETAWLANTATWPTAAFPEAAFLPANPSLLSIWEARAAS